MNDYLKYLFIFNWFLPFSMPTEINIFNTNPLYCSLKEISRDKSEKSLSYALLTILLILYVIVEELQIQNR